MNQTIPNLLARIASKIKKIRDKNDHPIEFHIESQIDAIITFTLSSLRSSLDVVLYLFEQSELHLENKKGKKLHYLVPSAIYDDTSSL